MTVTSLPLKKTGKSNAPLNVCFPVNYLDYGGAERQLVELALGLDKSDFRVHVVTLIPGGALEDELHGQPGISLHTVNRRNKYDLVSPTVGLARLLRHHRVHIVQPFLSPATLYGMAASFLARTPIRIVTERCGVRINTGMGNKLYRFVEDRLTRFARVAVANSEAGREYLHCRGIDSSVIQVIYNGVGMERLTPDKAKSQGIRADLDVPENGVVVGTAARLASAKDQASLLKAVATLLPDFPGLRVALVGDGPSRNDLEGLARSLGIKSQVKFFGSQRRVADFIGAFDVAVLTSIDIEGCSNFLLEAMGMGKPVIATDIGGNPELVREGINGHLVPPGEVGALAQTIKVMIQNPDVRAAMGDEGRKMVAERFSLVGMVEAYRNIYFDLARRVMGASLPGEEMAI